MVALVSLVACNDVRDFDGRWAGARVGDTAPVRIGLANDASATLTVTALDRLVFRGTLDVEGLCTGAQLSTIPGATADRLGSLSFDGAPLRVYLSFVATTDGGGDAMAFIALFDDDRIELRLVRGGPSPVYAIFALTR